MKTNQLLTTLLVAALLLNCGSIGIAQEQQPSVPERLAALKAIIANSQANLRQYEWIQTTVVSLKGEEKSRKQERCYYGADGVLQKVEVSQSPTPKEKPGLRGKIVASKKSELTDYMKNAIGLVKTYVPPSPTRLQAARDTGKTSMDLLEPGKRVRLNFRDYEKPGDLLGVEVDMMNNRPLGLKVSTYLDNVKDAVTLDVIMGELNDGTIYASDVTLYAKAKDLKVTVKNSGYRKMN